MDRLSRIATHGGLALLLGSMVSSLGCRSMKSEIPPGKAYSTTGAPTPPSVGFSADPRPDASAAGGLYNGVQQASGNSAISGPQAGVQRAAGDAEAGTAGGQPQFGTPIGNKHDYTDAMPAAGRYGPPGTTSLPVPGTTPQPAAAPADKSSPGSDSPLQGALGVDLP